VIDPDGRFEYSDGYSTRDSRSETASVAHSGTFLNGGGGWPPDGKWPSPDRHDPLRQLANGIKDAYHFLSSDKVSGEDKVEFVAQIVLPTKAINVSFMLVNGQHNEITMEEAMEAGAEVLLVAAAVASGGESKMATLSDDIARISVGARFTTNAAKTNTNVYKHSFKYADRVRMRGVQDPVSHNFPYSFDDAILSTNPIFEKNGYKMFQQTGTMNGKNGVFEIGLTKDGIIDHRFFRPIK